MSSAIHKIIIREIEVRIIDSGIHRIIACVEKLDKNQLRYRPNINSNSINNQILHLDGNVRQWLIASLSEASDERKRKREFDHTNQKSKEYLLDVLHNLELDIRRLLPSIHELDLTEEKVVQCYNETNLSIIMHVIEHFSYHVGQITYITKMLLDIDTGYYDGQNLDQVN